MYPNSFFPINPANNTTPNAKRGKPFIYLPYGNAQTIGVGPFATDLKEIEKAREALDIKARQLAERDAQNERECIDSCGSL